MYFLQKTVLYASHQKRTLVTLEREFGLLAQSVEHLTFNQVVTGSIPVQPTKFVKPLMETLAVFLCLSLWLKLPLKEWTDRKPQ